MTFDFRDKITQKTDTQTFFFLLYFPPSLRAERGNSGKSL